MVWLRVVIAALWLAGCCVQVPPVGAQCVNSTGTCGSSVTANLSLCRLPTTCKNPDYAANLENAFIDLDTLFAATVQLGGHGHRGTSGDGPKLSADTALNCSNSPADGECLAWDTGTGQCTWTTCGSGGGGSGDVTGPASSVDSRLVLFDGPTGKIIKDNGDALSGWTVDIDHNLLSGGVTPGAIGILDTSPDAWVDVDNNNSTVLPAFGAVCTGAKTASLTCGASIIDQTTSSTASLIKTGVSIANAGTNNGASSVTRGLFIDIDSTTNTFPVGIYIQDGHQLMLGGRMGIGMSTVPAAALHVLNNEQALNTLVATKSAVTDLATTTALVTNVTTGGLGAGVFKTGMQVNSTGAWNGLNVAFLANATGGAQANLAFAALAGGISTQNGDIDTASGNIIASAGAFNGTAVAATAGLNLTCSGGGGAVACANLTSTGLVDDAVLRITGTGSSGENNGILTTVTATGSSNVTGMFFTADAADGRAVGLRLDVSGKDIDAIDLNVSADADASAAFGMRMFMDGNSGTGAGVGLFIDFVEAFGTANRAIVTEGGDILFGPSTNEYFFVSDATRQTLINDGAAPDTTAALEAHGDEDKAAIAAICTSTGGGDNCLSITAANTGSGTVEGLFIGVSDDGTAGDVIGLTVSATGAPVGNNIAINAAAGDVVFGATELTEDFHYNQADEQFIFNVDSGVASHPGESVLEVHNNVTGLGIGVDIIAAGSGTDIGLALRAAKTGAVTAASSGSVLTNSQTSSTNAINKVGVQVTSTGTWDGTGSLNAGVQSSATGATNAGDNYAFWALQGGVRGPWFIYDPLDDPPFTCDSAHKGATAMDGPAGVLCVCSDSDGASFEWESVGLPLVTCTF